MCVGAEAQTEISIRGSARLFPVAIPQMCLQVGSSNVAKEIPEVISRDLDISGFFQLVAPQSFIETPGKCAGADGFAYSDWSVIGAEGLVRGIIVEESGQIKAQLFLHDVQRQQVVLAKEYVADAAQYRKIAHRFANEIMKFFTGEYGVFGTQIAFSSKVGRFKEIFVMDMDGSNVRQLTNDRGLAMSSSWNPAGNALAFTSYRSRIPDLFTIDVASRAITQVTRGPAMELGGRFLPGDRFLVSRSIGDDSDILVLGKDGSVQAKLTPPNGAIDVSPVVSPDGTSMLFVSNRAGGPQVYSMRMDGSGVTRVSFVTSNYCTSPSWSPKGDRIAFVCRADSGFQIFTAAPDGSSPLQLTSVGDNEDPEFSPDGRYLVFASTYERGAGNFGIALMRVDGSAFTYITKGRSIDSEPTWGPLVD